MGCGKGWASGLWRHFWGMRPMRLTAMAAGDWRERSGQVSATLAGFLPVFQRLPSLWV